MLVSKFMPRANDQQITASLNAWSVNLGIHRDALTRRLHDARIKWETGDDISATDIFAAMTSQKDEAAAQTLMGLTPERLEKFSQYIDSLPEPTETPT